MKPSTSLSAQARVFSMASPCMWRTVILVMRDRVPGNIRAQHPHPHNLAACRAPSRECACQDDVHSRLERSSNAPLLLGHRRARSKPHAYSASVEPKLRPNPLVLLVTIHVAARNPRRTPSGVEVGNIRRRRCRLGEARPTCAGLLLAPLRHADCVEQCPSLRATRKTYARTEFFSV
jgi:hypothetical protein